MARARYYGGANATVGLDGSGKTEGVDRLAAVALPAALRRIHTACAAAGLTVAEATARWHFHNSALVPGDGVIMGAASLEQLEDNLTLVAAAGRAGPLPVAVEAAVEAAWAVDLAGPAEYPGMGAMPLNARL